MKINLYILLVIFTVSGLSSCVTHRKVIPTSPMVSMINFDMDDLQYVGEVNGEAVQSYILGIPVGGERNRYYSASFNFSPYTSTRGFRNAMYEALMQKPDADFILPVGFSVESHKGFLGRKDYIKVKAKVFTLKTKTE